MKGNTVLTLTVQPNINNSDTDVLHYRCTCQWVESFLKQACRGHNYLHFQLEMDLRKGIEKEAANRGLNSLGVPFSDCGILTGKQFCRLDTYTTSKTCFSTLSSQPGEEKKNPHQATEFLFTSHSGPFSLFSFFSHAHRVSGAVRWAA